MMTSYLWVQGKRILRQFIPTLITMLCLFICLALILAGVVLNYTGKEENRIFTIGITGDTQEEFFRMGLAALKTLDDTRFSIEFVEMEEEEALKALERADISAYMIIPEDFIVNALWGEVEPIQVVTTAGSSNMITMFKNEMTEVVTELVMAAEKGAYGIHDALIDSGAGDPQWETTDQLSIEYVELILKRGDLLVVQEIGLGNGVGTLVYYLISLSLFFLFLMGLPFVSFHYRRDHSLDRQLYAKGLSFIKQILAEYLVSFLAMLILTIIVMIPEGIILKSIPQEMMILSKPESLFLLIFNVVITVAMVTAFNLVIFEVAGSMVSGVLLHFFITLSTSYAAGCFYPLHTLPDPVQNAAIWFPQYHAHNAMALAFDGSGSPIYIGTTILFAIAFLIIAFIVRTKKCKWEGGRI